MWSDREGQGNLQVNWVHSLVMLGLYATNLQQMTKVESLAARSVWKVCTMYTVGVTTQQWLCVCVCVDTNPKVSFTNGPWRAKIRNHQTHQVSFAGFGVRGRCSLDPPLLLCWGFVYLYTLAEANHWCSPAVCIVLYIEQPFPSISLSLQILRSWCQRPS